MARGRRSELRRSILLAMAALMLAPAALAQDVRPVLVFAAASLKNALDPVTAAFTADTGIKVTTSYAATSALAKQVEQGAPADIFFSADLEWMDYLEARQLIRPETRTSLLGNRLVLVAAADSKLGAIEPEPGFDLSGALGGGRLAVAGVEAVPAGRYAKAALEKLGAWPSVSGRLAQAENVRAALAFVSRGEAPLGIVYHTDAAADPNVKIVGIFPESSHPPIIYPVALTSTASASGPEKLLAHLRSSAAAATFKAQGFSMVGQPAS